MVNLKAIKTFNYGGLIVQKKDSVFEVSDSDAFKLLKLKLAKKVIKSHKEIQVK